MGLEGYVSPLEGVTVRECVSPRLVETPAYRGEDICVSRDEFSMEAPGVGRFYARGGMEVEYSVFPGADEGWVRLCLDTRILVALMHQRKIVNFHASSFVHAGLGVMILGETGAGKSSLTLSFALRGGGFLTDDLTPLLFEEVQPYIMPLLRRVKIRRDTAEKLGIDPLLLSEAENGTGKKYLSITPMQMNPHPLDVIVQIETGPVNKPVITEPSSAERFSLLRSEVCSWELLAGMPETERIYLQQLVSLVEKTRFVRVMRPAESGLKEFYSVIRKAIDNVVKS